jgi:hypothetical protein
MDHEFDVAKLRAWRRLEVEQTRAREPAHLLGETGASSVDEEELARPCCSSEAEPNAAPAEADGNPLERYRARLAAQYGLDCEYIGVSQLAQILGVSPSAIYGHMRAGRFFLPYRMFNAAPKIFIDDLVAWQCSGSGVVPAFGPKPRRDAPAREDDDWRGKSLTQTEVDAAVNQAADDALRSMGIDPSKRRRKRRAP